MTNGISCAFTWTASIIGRSLLVLGVLLLGACATRPGPLRALSNIVVTGSGVDNECEACAVL